MWGTIARMRVRPDVPEEYLRGQMRAFNTDRMLGWLSTAFYRSDDDPRELWLVAMFEDKSHIARTPRAPCSTPCT